MAKRREQVETKHNTVKTLQNDYVRTTDSQSKMLQKQKVLFRRRMLVFTIFASAILVFLISTIVKQNDRLVDKQKQKEEVIAQLEEVKEQQDKLNLQITKLEDDEYLAKLARKEYFLSDDGEIIFTIPEEGNKEQKKQKDKE
ncbi:cell division protein DivIC [Lysinibacillus composti]|uniref:Septum formation initiator n=1 Tax=Lysinibacillus composti TaxID=720633 RepID=A0A3N9U9Q6_9BACI|nr:septum formation initiator family protein [Lysinibacillus composti]MBM7610105.1 cell division protein DivIC [Lysinibacillus composti]RQW73247.1 septum formation initiator [Lysinibacillus composti]